MLIPIDFERSFPNEWMMEHLNDLKITILYRYEKDGLFSPSDSEPAWNPGDPIIGSLDEKRHLTNVYGGPDKRWESLFNESITDIPNPYIYMLNHVKELSATEAGNIPLKPDFVFMCLYILCNFLDLGSRRHGRSP